MHSPPRVTVVTPTYNERGSITELIERVCSLSIPNLDIVVVDDNSPDGTGTIAAELAKKYPVQIVHRAGKEGLGKAYMHAFATVCDRPAGKRPDYIIQIDADLSHNPADIPRFLERIVSCDVVLGSRYVPGGGIEHWNRLRHAISRIGNIYAALVLGLPYRDLTNGYKCIRREVIEALRHSAVNSVGYNFQIETTYHAHKKGFKICEIPIIFTERTFGNSKFNVGIILESFWKVLMLRNRK